MLSSLVLFTFLLAESGSELLVSQGQGEKDLILMVDLFCFLLRNILRVSHPSSLKLLRLELSLGLRMMSFHKGPIQMSVNRAIPEAINTWSHYAERVILLYACGGRIKVRQYSILMPNKISQKKKRHNDRCLFHHFVCWLGVWEIFTSHEFFSVGVRIFEILQNGAVSFRCWGTDNV